MDLSAFARYALLHERTGTLLYTTCATPTEIASANANLRRRGLPHRFLPVELLPHHAAPA